MKKILIIKTGTTFPELLAERGDFEDWVISGMGVGKENVEVVDAYKGASLPGYDRWSGIVVPGSHDMVTDRSDWSERVARWLPGAIERRIPTLGICYGHQLLALSLGGEAADNPNGLEYGTTDVYLTPQGKVDPLFEGVDNPFKTHVSHTQTVLKLPPGAKVLASNDIDPHHGFVYAGTAWGVQFHPEFDAGITRAYVRRCARLLEKEGQDPDRLAGACEDSPAGTTILANFARIVGREAGEPS